MIASVILSIYFKMKVFNKANSVGVEILPILIMVVVTLIREQHNRGAVIAFPVQLPKC